MSDEFLSVRNLCKQYPGVLALDDVSITFRAGEVHAIIGENGAGKSTFIKLLSGALKPDGGSVWMGQDRVSFENPIEALDHGVRVIYQELTLLPELTVAENIFLNNQPLNSLGLVDYKQMEVSAKEILNQLNVQIDPIVKVKNLRIAQQQLVEIARGISTQGRVLIMDEPTDALNNQEARNLFKIIDDLKRQGILVIFITHRLEEIFKIADRVTVLKDGKYVETMYVGETDTRQLARLMVGRPVSAVFPKAKKKDQSANECLRVENLSTSGMVKNINFALLEGEIVGLAGLMGSGRTELVHALFGFEFLESGSIWVNEIKQEIKSPKSAIRSGMGYVTSDRKHEGLVLSHSVRHNMALPSLDRRQHWGIINHEAEKRTVQLMCDKLNIRTPSLKQLVKYLSGGNQQKIVLAKWMLNDPDILFFNEPTRGVDIGAKQEIYELMRQITGEGKTILMISSELPEILGMSDRILVMDQGRLVGNLNREDATEEKLMLMATGQIN